jgi:hypothetical protein
MALQADRQQVEESARRNPGKHYRPSDPTVRQTRDRFNALSPTPFKLHQLEAYLVCYLQRFDLRAEMAALIEHPDPRRSWPAQTAAAATEVLYRDRGCPSYITYVVGLNPKDHLMEHRVVALEEDRRLFQRALSRATNWFAVIGSLLAAAALIPESIRADVLRAFGHFVVRLGEAFLGLVP